METLNADKKQGGKCVHFGETALMESDCKRTATVTVTSQSAAVLALNKATFESVLGPLKDIINDANQERNADARTANDSAAHISMWHMVRKMGY